MTSRNFENDAGVRFNALDGLRALAVMGVLVDHYLPHELWFQSLLQWGQLGVQLFFVISGFLITRILLDMRPDGTRPGLRQALKVFYLRRALRIFPPYYALLLVYVLIGVKFQHGAAWACPLYVFNFLGLFTNDPFEFLGHFWSLCVEEQFYLAWPLVVLALPRPWIAPVAADVPYNALRSLPLSQFDFLGCGALLAILRWRESTLPGLAFWEKWRLWIGLAGLIIHVILLKWPQTPTQSMFNASGAAVMMTALVDWAAHGTKSKAQSLLMLPPLVYVGKISYGIYLYQFLTLFLLYKVQSLLGHPAFLNGPLGFAGLWAALTLLVAMASWHFFERPLLKLKRFFPYRGGLVADENSPPLPVRPQGGVCGK
jgi:peptidoglycan/LPS O-acetylase OafA/YrhL